MRVREGIPVCTELSGRAHPVSPRYFVKSRDILMGCLETSLFFGLSFVSLLDSALSRGSFSWSGLQASGLAVFVGVDGEFSEDFAGVGVDDRDV